MKCGILAVLFLAAIAARPVSALEALPALDFQKIIAGLSHVPYDSVKMAQGPDESVYIAGCDYTADSCSLIRLDSAGNMLWDKAVTLPPVLFMISGVAVDGGGNAYVALTDFDNYRTSLVKYGPGGNLIKSVAMPAAGVEPVSGGLAFDRSRGKLYVSQWYVSPDLTRYFAMAAVYNGDLDLQGVKNVELGDFGWDVNVSLDVDGNIYLGGTGSGREPEYVAVKYSPGLIDEVWSVRAPVGGYYGRFFYLFSNAVPNGGMAFWSKSQSGSVLRRVSSGGVFTWALDIPNGDWDMPIFDSQGGGYLQSLAPDYATTGLVKISTAGEYAWGSSILTDPPGSYLRQAMIGKSDKIYTYGDFCGDSGCDLYLARYTPGAAKYSIRISTGDMQTVVVSSYTAPMVSLVNVFGTTNPASETGVSFSISTFPVGAIGQELSKSSAATDADGLADVILKLGNIPAEYGVTATCDSCEASASSVTFTCCGKLPNDDFKQYDVRWATHPYNTQTVQYNKNIKQKGCAITSLATLLNYYGGAFTELGISTTNPKDLNDTLVYKLKKRGYGFDDQHRLKFEMVSSTMVSNGKVVFNGRSDYSLPLAPSDINNLRSLIDGDLNHKLPVVISINRSILVLNQTTGTQDVKTWIHFMMVVGRCYNEYIVSDPGSGTRSLLDPEESIVLDEQTGNTFGPVVGIRRFKKK